MKHWRSRRPKWLAYLGLADKRHEIEKWRGVGLTVMALCGLVVMVTLQNQAVLSGDSDIHSHSRSIGRKLLADNITTEHSECAFEENHIPEAWVFCYFIFILIIFIAFAIICDDFFVPSLEIISEKLNLSEDVAGATFMAAGSSAPELFTSVAGVSQETDVGVGTIVGSAIFNLLIIIALTAALAGQVLHLDWRPLIRDSFFYAMSIGCFIGFAWDGYFQHFEASILLALYILYIVLMIFNPKVMDWMGTWCSCCKASEVSPEDDAEKSNDAQTQLNHTTSGDMANGKERRNSQFHHHTKKQPEVEVIKEENDKAQKEEEEEDDNDEEETMQICPCCPCCPAVRTHPPSADQARQEGGCWNWTKFVLRWIIFIPAFPFVCLFSWTIPDCSKDHLKKYYILSFIMAVIWIAALSMAMVTIVERCGCLLGIDTYIMGVIVVAIGTSIPDALSSVLVARDGYGDMAVSNAIGSNVFDINLGLGLPFIIRICIDGGAPISLLETEDWVDYYDGSMQLVPHAKFGFFLLLFLFLALMVFGCARFRLNKWIGISFVFMYLLFITYALIQELVCIRRLNQRC